MADQLFASRLKTVKGVLLDITGVLKDGNTTAIPGSVDAVSRLLSSGLPVRLCTNETGCTRKFLVDGLETLGFKNIEIKKVFSPIPAVCHVLTERNLRPNLLVKPECMPDFDGIDQSNPNCVVLGDAVHQFSYQNLNAAFRCLKSLDNPMLFALGKGRYYQEDGELHLDVGAFMAALEYATGLTAEVVGKPSPLFFNTVLQDMGIKASEAVMVGDDIENDIGGAQACGMIGVQVRTGKYRPQDEPHPTVKPDAYVDNLAQFTDLLLKNVSL